ncbi:MAG: HEPN domain-containing protein [Chloroflexota bacterium]|nr:HEPN domain-containing protein [Chloroflexota bacterium]
MSQSEAKVWLEYSESDLHAAQTLLESKEFFPLQICFLSQQSAEKAIKAVLVFEDVNFPKVHDLDRLRDLIPKGWKVKKQFPDLAELTIWAVEARYPADMPAVTEGEARETFRLAESVYETVATELHERIQQTSS